MHDSELRDRFSEWARPMESAAPPPIPVIRQRARRRMARITASGLAAGIVLAAGTFQLTHVLGAGKARVPVTSTSPSPAVSRKPAPGSAYAAAPYYIAATSDGSAGVWDAVTGQRLAKIAAPAESSAIGHYRTFFAYIAAAGDDRTFVLAAIANTNSTKASPVWLFREHLAADGTPGPLHPLTFRRERQGIVGHWYQNIASMALSFDGTKLAIATNRINSDNNGPADIEVVTLATGATRTWTSTPQDISSLSWAGDTKVAFACDGVCVLDTSRPGSSLSQARTVIPWLFRYRGMQGLQFPMITPDGSAIYVAMERGGLALVEFSARTGQPLRVVIQPQYDDFCGALWSDATGRHLMAACSWTSLAGTITNGHFARAPRLRPANIEDDGSGAGGFVIGW
jgi:hypothetical protein